MSSLSPLIGKRSRRNLPPVDWFLVSLEAIVGPLLGDRACYALSSKIRCDQIVTRTDPVILAILGSPPSRRPGPIHLDEEAAQASWIEDGVAETPGSARSDPHWSRRRGGVRSRGARPERRWVFPGRSCARSARRRRSSRCNRA